MEERDRQLVSLEQSQAALRLEADTAHRKCEDMRRACDLNLSDLQVETARQLSVLRRKNDSFGRENDQLRVQAGTAASELSAAGERQRHELNELERQLQASKREREEEVHALEARLGELAAKLQCLEAKNRELEAGGRDAAKVRQAAVSGLEAAVSGLEEENRGLRQEVRMRRQDMAHILEEREELLGEARAREDHLINSLRVLYGRHSILTFHITLLKKKIKCFSYIRKFRKDQVQSHI